MMSGSPRELLSSDAREVAHYLVQQYVTQLANAHPEIANHIRDLEAVTLDAKNPNGTSKEALQAQKDATFKHVLDDVKSLQDKRTLIDAYAKMGHLNDLGGLIARENYLRNYRVDGRTAAPGGPGGPEEFVHKSRESLDQLIERFNSPAFEIVMTAHPTSVNSQELSASLREVGKAADALRRQERDGNYGDTRGLQQALAHFADVTLLPHDRVEGPDGQVSIKERNLGVEDETRMVLYHLGTIYEDLPQVYRHFDQALERKNADYNPLALNLKMRFSSWGSSGDKDGNAKVNADTTMSAIALHRMALAEHYLQDIEAVKVPAAYANQWQHWQATLQEVKQGYKALHDKLASSQGIDAAHFEEYQKQLQALEGAFDADALKNNLEEIYESARTSEPEFAQHTLNLLRRVRTFGSSFARIEYRETAEEYTRIIEYLVPGYKEMDESGRVQALGDILQTPGKAKELLQAKWSEIRSGGPQKPYSNDNVLPIAYHTIRRMELARDCPSMVTDNVLAECETTSNLLEAVFLQQAVEANGKRAELGVVPLFESPEVMPHVGEIMGRAYDNTAYQQHLALLQQKQGADKPVQQVQLAHSDNTRRAGLPAARAFIHQAHDLLRTAGKEHGIQTQFFQGGSMSDPYRGGVRAPTALVNQFHVYDFLKFTFQGGDNLNYFNYPGSTERLFARSMTHMAKHYDDEVQMLAGETWDSINAAVTKALQSTCDDYQQEVFQKEKLGTIMGVLQDAQRGAGTVGSRAKARSGPAFGKVDSVSVGKVQAVDVRNVRTITFSEILQHGGIVPTWLGAYTLEDELNKALNDIPEGQKLLAPAEGGDKGVLSAPAFQKLYKESPVFRDVMDRVMYGVVTSDLDGLAARHEQVRNDAFFQQRLMPEYKQAARMAYAALTGRFPAPEQMQEASSLRDAVLDEMPHSKAVLTNKLAYAEFAQAARDDWNKQLKENPPQDEQQSSLVNSIFQRIHAALDIVTHGRNPTIDDIRYGQALTGGKQR